RRGATPVLDEEQSEPLLGRTQVLLGVERSQHRVGRDAGVEDRDDRLEGLRPTDLVVERVGHELPSSADASGFAFGQNMRGARGTSIRSKSKRALIRSR